MELQITHIDDSLTKYVLMKSHFLGDNDIYAIGCVMSCGPCNFLFDFAVAPEFRRKGYGTKFMELMTNDYNVNCLDVDVDNTPAINLYENFYFRITDTLHEYKTIEGSPKVYETYWMERQPFTLEEKKALYKKIQQYAKKNAGYTLLNEYLVDDNDVMSCISNSGKI